MGRILLLLLENGQGEGRRERGGELSERWITPRSRRGENGESSGEGSRCGVEVPGAAKLPNWFGVDASSGAAGAPALCISTDPQLALPALHTCAPTASNWAGGGKQTSRPREKEESSLIQLLITIISYINWCSAFCIIYYLFHLVI